jgi:hypothetical protein
MSKLYTKDNLFTIIMFDIQVWPWPLNWPLSMTHHHHVLHILCQIIPKFIQERQNCDWMQPSLHFYEIFISRHWNTSDLDLCRRDPIHVHNTSSLCSTYLYIVIFKLASSGEKKKDTKCDVRKSKFTEFLLTIFTTS